MIHLCTHEENILPRVKLLNRRPHETFQFRHAGMEFTAGFAKFYPYDNYAEVWLDCHKAGSSMQSIARDVAIVISHALQRGASISELRHSLTRLEDGAPASLVGALLDQL